MRTTNLKKMAKLAQSGLLAVLALAVLSCEARTDRQDDGGIIMTVSDFDGLPSLVRVNSPVPPSVCSRSSPTNCFVVLDQVTIRSIVKNPGSPTSDLMTVEFRAYEVRFSRRQPGTRTPPPYFENIFGNLAPGATTTFDNLPLLGPAQLLTAPLSDLLFAEGAIDDETGSTTITLDAELRFYGRTISGKDVVTDEPARFTLTLLP
jgi:hypothetical protein